MRKTVANKTSYLFFCCNDFSDSIINQNYCVSKITLCRPIVALAEQAKCQDAMRITQTVSQDLQMWGEMINVSLKAVSNL